MKRPIPSAPEYLADDEGGIWHGQELKRPTSVHRSGHLQMKVRVNGVYRHAYVHRLVCEAFHGPCPEGRECRHKDGNPLNNAETNLTWGTKAENIADKVKHGASRPGTAQSTAVLTEELIVKARARKANGETIASIARSYGVNRFTLRNAVAGIKWKHTTGSPNQSDAKKSDEKREG